MENDIRRKLFVDAGSRGGTNFSQVTINLQILILLLLE